MTGNANEPHPRRRPRRIGWFLPLAGAPIVFFVGILIAGTLDQLGAPELLWRVPWALGIGGAVVAIVVFLVEVVRSLSPDAGRLTAAEEIEYREDVSRSGGDEDPRQPWSASAHGAQVPPGAPRTRRHRTWALPLATIPLIIAVAVLVILALRSVDAPREAIRTVTVTMILGIAVSLVFVVVGLVRFFRAPPKPRAPRPPRRPGAYASLAAEDAARRGLTVEEYGVYKGSVGSVVRPVNSAGGLLFIAILLTVLNGFILVLIGVSIAQANGLLASNPDDHPLGPVEWGFLVLEMLFTPIAWRYYLAERRAQKLRVARGLPPTLR